MAENNYTMNIQVYEPKTFADAETIAKSIVDGRAAIMNIRRMRTDEAQRAIDFLTGVIYALNGTIQKIGHKVLLISPANCTVEGTINYLEEE